MKKLLIITLVIPVIAAAQARFGHFDTIELNRLRQEAVTLSHDHSAAIQQEVTFFMRIADDAALGRVAAAGATVDQREGNIVVATAALADLDNIVACEGVVTASLPRMMDVHASGATPRYDLSRTKLGLDKAHSGATPLTQPYTGAGVIVGIIDMGIDVHHAAFLNPDGTHRVKRIWKHAVSGKSSITVTSDTEEKIAKWRTDEAAATHGTHVMGIAAGSFNDAAIGGYDLRGAAPDADIVVSCGVADNVHLLKGLRLIADYAKEQGKPCVINVSMGSNIGPHDGSDEFPAGMNEIAADPNVTICVSSGNEGAGQAFLYKEFTVADNAPLKSIIAPTSYTAALFPGISFYPQAVGQMEIWSDDATPFDVYIDMLRFVENQPVVISTFKLPASGSGYKTNGGYLAIDPDVTDDKDAEFNAIYPSSYIGGETSVYAASNRYHAELAFQLQCNNIEEFQQNFMSLRIEGQPGHRVWVYGYPSNGVFPFALVGGTFDGYTTSIGEGSINALAGASNVITVGSYVTHNFPALLGYSQEKVGETATYSSWGPTIDGRMHPLINAPGSRIISSMSSEYVASSNYDADSQPKAYTVTVGGTEYHFTPMSGTSMASPFMAGVAAMWLSADPTLTSADILRIAQETAATPANAQPNDGASGHLDAFSGLCRVLEQSGIRDVTVSDSVPFSVVRSSNGYTILAPAASHISAEVYALDGTLAAAASAKAQKLDIDCRSHLKGIYILTVNIDGHISSQKIQL